MAEAQALTVGLIGCGGIMDWHIRNLVKVPNVTVGAMAEPVPANMERYQQRYPELAQATTYPDHRKMLAGSKLDAVIICSRHSDHFPQIMDCLAENCHVLVEKPFVETVAYARRAIAAARARRKVLMISYQRHFDARFRWVREVVQSGRIGKVQAITSALGQGWMTGTRGSWRQDPKYSCGGQLNDSGSHIVDIALWTTGLEPVEVYAIINNCGTKVDINSALSVRLNNGAVWTINIGGNTPGFWEHLTISGDKGTILLTPEGNVILKEGRIQTRGESYGGYHDQTAGFIRAIRGQSPNEVPGEFGMLVTGLTQAAFRSAKLKKPVKIKL